MSLWSVKVQHNENPEDTWTALVLAPTEIGAKRSAIKHIGTGEYHSTEAVAVDPYRTGTILTVQDGVGVQYERKEANTNGQW